MDISFTHNTICSLVLGMSCLKWDIFIFSSLDLMSENPAHVSGSTILIMTNKVADPSYWVLKVYVDLKALNLRLTSLIKYFLIHRHIILYLRRG